MRRAILLILFLLGGPLAALHVQAAGNTASYAGAPLSVDGFQVPARVIGPNISLAVGGKFQSRFWAGVNLGSTVPGRSPGEVAPTRADYDRWLLGMGQMGVHVLRVYTILRPSFYDAVLAYNTAHPTAPIYVIQGVWIPETEFNKTGNAYDPSVTDGFRTELARAVDVVHGSATLPVAPGHADGTFRSDISRWLLAFMIGIEWDPNSVSSTDRINAGTTPFSGHYFTASSGASPMESWIASMLDYLAGLEAARGWSRPLTFTNWLTLDPLHHPYEPSATEDLATIDATHISATANWPGGFFATYHAYPYYPDFLRFTPQYTQYRAAGNGQIDPYAGYLHALRVYHGNQAVMIGEFGVPSGLGIAHDGPAGRSQGNHSEQEMGAMDAAMLSDIHDEGFAGGMLFEWTDEWFKFSWNTVDEQLPADRRQLWFDALTNEEQFGLIATDPGSRQAVTLDGNEGEWAHNGSQVIQESRGPVREVRALKDEEYLYLAIRVRSPRIWQNGRVTIGFDVRPGENRSLPGLPGVDPQADVALSIGPGRHAAVYQSASTDTTAYEYGVHEHDFAVSMKALQPGSGVWVHPRLLLSRPLTIPATGQRVPAKLFEFKSLRWGTTNARAPSFDNRNLVDAKGDVIEVRMPWPFLTYSDPSSHQVYVPHSDGTITSETTGRIGIAISLGTGSLIRTGGYNWDNWNRVQWHERRTAGWSTVKAAIQGTSG